MNSCFVSSFVTFFMFSKSVLRLICILLVSFVVHLNWRANQFESLKIAGVSFVSRTFSVFYEYLPMVWRCLCCCCLSAVGRRASCIWVKVRSRLTPHYVTRHLLTHFVLKTFLPSSVLFRSKFV